MSEHYKHILQQYHAHCSPASLQMGSKYVA